MPENDAVECQPMATRMAITKLAGARSSVMSRADRRSGGVAVVRVVLMLLPQVLTCRKFWVVGDR